MRMRFDVSSYLMIIHCFDILLLLSTPPGMEYEPGFAAAMAAMRRALPMRCFADEDIFMPPY